MDYVNKHGFVPLGIYSIFEKLSIGGTYRHNNLRYIGTSEELDHSGWFHRFECVENNETIKIKIRDKDIVMVTKVGHVDLLRRESDKEFLSGYVNTQIPGQTWWVKIPPQQALVQAKIMVIDQFIVQLNTKIGLLTFKTSDVEFVKLIFDDSKLKDVNDHITNINYQLYNNKGKLENEISE